MATITPQLITTPFMSVAQVWLWETVTSDDTCTPVVCAGFNDKSIQVIGDFGGDASVAIHGSNIPGTPTTNHALDGNDSDTPIAITAAGVEEIVPAVYAIAPVVTGGTDEDLDIYVYLGKS